MWFKDEDGYVDPTKKQVQIRSNIELLWDEIKGYYKCTFLKLL